MLRIQLAKGSYPHMRVPLPLAPLPSLLPYLVVNGTWRLHVSCGKNMWNCWSCSYIPWESGFQNQWSEWGICYKRTRGSNPRIASHSVGRWKLAVAYLNTIYNLMRPHVVLCRCESQGQRLWIMHISPHSKNRSPFLLIYWWSMSAVN